MIEIVNSILTTIKKLLGISEEDDSFDTDIIVHINSAFSELNQLGFGPDSGYSIVDETSSWDEILSDSSKLEMVKTYIYLSVRLVFDPPTSASVMNALSKELEKLTWRISVSVDPKQ